MEFALILHVLWYAWVHFFGVISEVWSGFLAFLDSIWLCIIETRPPFWIGWPFTWRLVLFRLASHRYTYVMLPATRKYLSHSLWSGVNYESLKCSMTSFWQIPQLLVNTCLAQTWWPSGCPGATSASQWALSCCHSQSSVLRETGTWSSGWHSVDRALHVCENPTVLTRVVIWASFAHRWTLSSQAKRLLPSAYYLRLNIYTLNTLICYLLENKLFKTYLTTTV